MVWARTATSKKKKTKAVTLKPSQDQKIIQICLEPPQQLGQITFPDLVEELDIETVPAKYQNSCKYFVFESEFRARSFEIQA